MNTQGIKEIIKALSYDISIEDIAAFEDISAAEVQAIADQYAVDIAELRAYHSEMEG